MTVFQLVVVIFCGLLIGLAIYLLIRSLARMSKGQCCEGCSGCAQAEICSVRESSEAGMDNEQ